MLQQKQFKGERFILARGQGYGPSWERSQGSWSLKQLNSLQRKEEGRKEEREERRGRGEGKGEKRGYREGERKERGEHALLEEQCARIPETSLQVWLKDI